MLRVILLINKRQPPEFRIEKVFDDAIQSHFSEVLVTNEDYIVCRCVKQSVVETAALQKLNSRIPEMVREVLYLIVFDAQAFLFQKLLHARGWVKMCFSSQQALFVHHSVRRYIVQGGGAVHSPAYYSRTAFCPQISRNCSITGDFTWRN